MYRPKYEHISHPQVRNSVALQRTPNLNSASDKPPTSLGAIVEREILGQLDGE